MDATSTRSNAIGVYLALGSNVGEREAYVLRALRSLEAEGAALVLAVSDLYETVAVGMGEARPFVNAVAQVAPLLSPGDLLQRVKGIEATMGRRGGHNRPREIDIDIVAWDRRILEEPGLSVPHPRYAERPFVLVPLYDIAPAFVCPVTGLAIEELIAAAGAAGVTRISRRRLLASVPS